MGAPAKFTPDDLKVMARLRRHGASASAIARVFDVTPQAIDYRLRTSRARLLDDKRQLHRLCDPVPAKVLAVVWLKETKSRSGEATETPAPDKPAEAAPLASCRAATAPASAPPVSTRPAGRIDLSTAPSSMEERAAAWRGKPPPPRPDRLATLIGEGQAWCRCGGREPGQRGGAVPPWFGRDCIEAGCPLKGAA